MGTTDICDQHPPGLRVVRSSLKHYGGRLRCSGRIATIRLGPGSHGLKALLAEPSQGRIAVVDVGGRYFAVLGDRMANLAHQNDWSGLIINGYIRDSRPIQEIPIAVWALGTCPQKGSDKPGSKLGQSLHFGAVSFEPDGYLYADDDGIILVDQPLSDVSF